MDTAASTDKGIGLGLLFSLVSVIGALLTGVIAYEYALQHAAHQASRSLQVNGGIAFTLAMVAGGIAIVAIHVYDG
jgi:hypothetical protein